MKARACSPIAKYKVGDIVKGRTAVRQPIISMRIDKVVNQRGWVGEPTPSYIVTDLSNLFGISGYFIGEELIQP